MSELGVNSMPLGHKGGEYATTVFMSDPDGDRVYTGMWQFRNRWKNFQAM